MLSTKPPSWKDDSITLEEKGWKVHSQQTYGERVEIRSHTRGMDFTPQGGGDQNACFVEEGREGKAFREGRSLC